MASNLLAMASNLQIRVEHLEKFLQIRRRTGSFVQPLEVDCFLVVLVGQLACCRAHKKQHGVLDSHSSVSTDDIAAEGSI